jgi:hypothetical protein
MCLSETYSNICTGKYLSFNFLIQYSLNQGDALSPLLFKFALKYSIKKVKETQVALKINGTYRLLAHADDVNLLRENIDTTCTYKNRNFI